MNTPHAIELDVGEVETIAELHTVLAVRLAFRSWYGRNWDAFWDCISDPQLSKMPPHLRIIGIRQLSARFPRDASIFRRCLEELPLERPEIVMDLRG